MINSLSTDDIKGGDSSTNSPKFSTLNDFFCFCSITSLNSLKQQGFQNVIVLPCLHSIILKGGIFYLK